MHPPCVRAHLKLPPVPRASASEARSPVEMGGVRPPAAGRALVGRVLDARPRPARRLTRPGQLRLQRFPSGLIGHVTSWPASSSDARGYLADRGQRTHTSRVFSRGGSSPRSTLSRRPRRVHRHSLCSRHRRDIETLHRIAVETIPPRPWPRLCRATGRALVAPDGLGSRCVAPRSAGDGFRIVACPVR